MNAHVLNALVLPPESSGPESSGPAAHPLRAQGGEAGPPDYLAALRARAGQILGTSGWVVMDQTRIDRFAQATGDRQFMHVDPVRAAAETPFGGTIAHGYLTLSMIGTFAAEVLPPHPAVRMVVNLGADKVRLLAPVRVNQRIRGVFVLVGLTALPESKAALRARVTIEATGPGPSAEAGPAPVLTADLSLMLVLADPVAVTPELAQIDT